jgi:hypothetical protein
VWNFANATLYVLCALLNFISNCNEFHWLCNLHFILTLFSQMHEVGAIVWERGSV